MRGSSDGNSDVTGNDVTGNGLTGNDIIRSDVTGSVRELISAPFFSSGFSRVFSSEASQGLLGNFWEFPIGHSIFSAVFLFNNIDE